MTRGCVVCVYVRSSCFISLFVRLYTCVSRRGKNSDVSYTSGRERYDGITLGYKKKSKRTTGGDDDRRPTKDDARSTDDDDRRRARGRIERFRVASSRSSRVVSHRVARVGGSSARRQSRAVPSAARRRDDDGDARERRDDGRRRARTRVNRHTSRVARRDGVETDARERRGGDDGAIDGCGASRLRVSLSATRRRRSERRTRRREWFDRCVRD